MTNTERVMGYLRAKGIPKKKLDEIRILLCEDAVTNSDNIIFNRIYTAIGVMLHRHYGFTGEQVMEGLQVFDSICGSVLHNEISWSEIMKELDDECGIIIRSGEYNKPICEYKAMDEEDDDMIVVE